MRAIWLALWGLIAVSAPAHAEWREAQSTNFVIYADDSERDLTRFAEKLERFHAAMELVTSIDLAPPSPSNRVTVFVVGNSRQVSRLFGAGGENIGGFYIPRAGAATAFVPDFHNNGPRADFSLQVLLHEYVHHFTIANSAFAQPRWMAEGGAEFFASAQFGDDGSVSLGLPAAHRYGELANDDVDVTELLDPEVFAERRRRGFGSFYGKSWALYHLLTFEPSRRGQFRQYRQFMAEGATSRAAAEGAFGSLADLDRDIYAYVRRPRLLSIRFSGEQLEPGPITVRQLTAGEAASMWLRMRSRRGVDAEMAAAVLEDARPLAERYPDDAAVFAALAEAEFDAGNTAEAIVAADRAIALDPGQVNAFVQKGFALFRLADELPPQGDRDAAYREAVRPFIALNRLENDHPLPLYYFFRGNAERGEVSDIAKQGLARAVELAPFDQSLRFALVRMRLHDGDLALAASALRPLAYAAHGGWFAEKSAEVIARIDAGATPEEGDALIALLTAPPPENAPPEEGVEGEES